MEEKYTISVSKVILRILSQFVLHFAYTTTVAFSVCCWLYSLVLCRRRLKFQKLKWTAMLIAVRFILLSFSVSHTEL